MIKDEDQSTTSDPISFKEEVYKDEVIGDRVEIAFEDDRGKTKFYPGTIYKLKMELEDGALDIQHFVEFDDGDERWFDLGGEERQGRLRWPSKKRKVKEEAKPEADAPAAPPSVTPPKKEESEVKQEATREATARKAPPTSVTPAKMQRTKMKEESKKDEYPMAPVKDEESSLPSEEHDTQGDSVPVLDPMPKSITAIIHYMDELEPDEDYYRRQADNRGECSKIRKKLRKFAKKNPSHPAIKYYVETKDWQPPDEATLNALIDLIKTMIK